jgi:hypothetical protein
MSDLVFEFADPAGDSLRIAWNGEALEQLDPAAEGATPPWSLAGELDWDEIAALRLLSARLGDQRLLAIVALRPLAAEGHGEEVLAGAVAGTEDFDQLEQTLFSTEYDPEGMPRRVGLELYPANGGLPLRVAGEVTATAVSESGGVQRLSAALILRSAGTEGVGVLDVLSPAAPAS